MAATAGENGDKAPPAGAAVARMRQALDPMPRLRARVVHGFGRGSKMLGFPTANMHVDWEMRDKPEELEKDARDVLEFAQNCQAGIYYAWAQVADGKDRGVYKVAMSVGWNPTFTDVKTKTIEPWILHDFEEDFYNCELRLLICGFVRPEAKFDVFDDLVTAIREDGDFCRAALDEPKLAEMARDPFFLETSPK
mmetsp:Transcript_45979/g.99873  ORF Transcript_45979/g.99873 Transcript_45979/m.99873 type:complete len:194 (-) Transcript_45979:33-614(-)|eukprot:CAMPEP_0170607862 /NCGR_PEP_ID=MMETSP0224-20130122/21277_1 /TAXON_ID=285029 /ORGANISM="Togula jolla, Strain CCCM 725" /LENGTH=193 /DNA_ID=CAMNT_0010933049 /DNA_START=49 /DNA_END=630 /DNA_ORIENTATION=+